MTESNYQVPDALPVFILSSVSSKASLMTTELLNAQHYHIVLISILFLKAGEVPSWRSVSVDALHLTRDRNGPAVREVLMMAIRTSGVAADEIQDLICEERR